MSEMVERPETVAVPFIQVGDRQCLTLEQVAEHEWLAKFVQDFAHCFEADPPLNVFWFHPRGKPNKFGWLGAA